MTAFPEIQKIRFEGPQSKNPLAFRHYNESEVVAGKTMKDHLRFSVAYWHTMRGTGGDPFGPGTMLRPWEGGRRLGRERHQPRPRRPSSSSRSCGARSTASTTATSPPKARRWPRPTRTSTRWSKVLKEEHAADRHQAALGHGQPVQQPALRPRRGHQPQRRRLRLRRRPGEEGPGSDQGAGRRRATRSGAAAKATRPSGTPT